MTGLGDMEEEIGNGASLFNDHGRDDSDFQVRRYLIYICLADEMIRLMDHIISSFNFC